MTKSLVLGANGFLGSHLVDALVRNGDDVRAFVRSGRKPQYNEADNIELFQGDFLNEADLKEALKGIDHVYHFISTTTPVTAEDDPTIDIETNIRMSVVLFRLCVEAQIKKVFFASTGGAIYGENDKLPFSETDLPLPVSPYAIGKLTIENYLRYFRRKHNLISVSLRISNPYGERQPFHRKQGVIPIFLENTYRDTQLTVYGDGSMVRDYIYVKDVANMIVNISRRHQNHELYNIGSGKGSTVTELLETVEKISEKKLEVEHVPVPPTFIARVVLDTSRFTDEFGDMATTSIEEGMRLTYEYIKTELNKQELK